MTKITEKNWGKNKKKYRKCSQEKTEPKTQSCTNPHWYTIWEKKNFCHLKKLIWLTINYKYYRAYLNHLNQLYVN